MSPALKAFVVDAILPPWPLLVAYQSMRENTMEEFVQTKPEGGMEEYGMGADVNLATPNASTPGFFSFGGPTTTTSLTVPTATLGAPQQNNSGQTATNWLTAITGAAKDIAGVVNPPKAPAIPKVQPAPTASNVPWTGIAIGGGILLAWLMFVSTRKGR